MSKKPTNIDSKELLDILHDLQETLHQINTRVRLQRLWWVGVMQGVAYGIGILLAFAVVVPVLLWILNSIDWIPIIGDIVSSVTERVELQTQGRFR